MGKYAFIKLIKIVDGEGDEVWTADLQILPGIPEGVHWERFGSNKFGWDLIYVYHPAYVTATDYYLIDANRLSLKISQIPLAKRQQLHNWLINKGYDTSWIIGNNTVLDVLKDILHHLNERYGVKEDLINFAKHLRN